MSWVMYSCFYCLWEFVGEHCSFAIQFPLLAFQCVCVVGRSVYVHRVWAKIVVVRVSDEESTLISRYSIENNINGGIVEKARWHLRSNAMD